MAGKKVQKKVLIVDYGSKSAENLKSLYESHPAKLKEKHPDLPEVEYKIDVVEEKDITSIPKQKLQQYHILHHSGARTSKNITNQSAKYLMENANPDAYILGSCYGAQIIAQHHGVESKKLKEYQKGSKEIDYQGKKVKIHKAHQWGIPVQGSESKLEGIASSDQEFHEGGKGQIHEIFRAKDNYKHIGIQGHGEQGEGKEIMYATLHMIHQETHGQQGKKQKAKKINFPQQNYQAKDYAA